MGLVSFFKNLKDEVFSNEVYGFNGNPDVYNQKLPVFPHWFFTARIGQPRSIDVNEVRQFSKSPWVQMVLNTIKRQIETIDTQIIKKDVEDETNYEEDIKKIEEFFEKVNSNNWDIIDMINPTITDIGEIDAGAWVKVFSKDSYEEKSVDVYDDLGNSVGTETRTVLKPFGQREMLELRLADGSTFLKQIDLYRRLQAYYQYSFKNPRTNPIRFEPCEVAYFYMNKKSYSLYGYSPVQSILQVLEALIQATRWNKDFFKNNAIPAGIIGLEGANADSMKKFEQMYLKKNKGKPHKLMFHNTKANFSDFMKNARDMEWLEGQKWYFHLVFAAFGVSPAEAGFYEDVNRSAQEGQERVTVKSAIKPYLKLFEKIINNDIIPEILQQEKPGIKWKFMPKDHNEEQIEFTQNMQELDHNTLTINEYRRSLGKDPVDWGDSPLSLSVNNDVNSNDKQEPNQQGSPEKNDEKEKSVITQEKKEFVNPGKEVIEESAEYSDFLSKTMKKWESKVLNAVDKVEHNKMFNPDKIKTFGEFLRDLMNSINTLAFIGKIRVYIKESMMEGLKSVEDEFNIQIGFTESMRKTVNKFEQQQLNGYTLADGKKWNGLKGSTKQMQHDILRIVHEGVSQNNTISEIKNDIKNVFDKATDYQAERIARTETTRFINEGKLEAFKISGLEGKKVWVSAKDNRTSDVCKRLDGLSVNPDEPFIDEITGVAFDYPPAHVNCRSVISFVQSKMNEE